MLSVLYHSGLLREESIPSLRCLCLDKLFFPALFADQSPLWLCWMADHSSDTLKVFLGLSPGSRFAEWGAFSECSILNFFYT